MARRNRSIGRSVAPPFSVRLYQEQLDQFQEEAKGTGRSVSAILRDRLDAADQTTDVLENMLDALRDMENRMEEMARDHGNTNSGNSGIAINAETLMLLRLLVRQSGKKNDLSMIQGELERQGITPWNPDSRKPER